MDYEKLAKLLKNPGEHYQDIKDALVEESKPAFDMQNAQNFSVDLKPDKSVSRGNFKPNPDHERGYLAHPSTIAALKKDIFVTDVDLQDYSLEIDCPSCKTKLDLQFWKFCPFCDSPFPKDLSQL